jgi:hypothetical protein
MVILLSGFGSVAMTTMRGILDKSKVLFSSFTYREAFKHLGIAELKRWELTAEPRYFPDC